MRLSTAQYESVYGAAQSELRRSWLVQDEGKREWLAKTVRDVIDEQSWRYVGPMLSASARRAMVADVKKRVHEENQECGFVIATILLAGVLSWLIQKLLDHLFPNV